MEIKYSRMAQASSGEFEYNREIQVPEGQSIIIDGPASFKIINGTGDILGMPLDSSQVIVVFSGRRVPIYATSNVTVAIRGHSPTKIIKEEIIPTCWHEASTSLLSILKGTSLPLTIFLIGAPNMGKTSMCTFLNNIFTRNGIKSAVIDADVGQSDIGPPTSISMALSEHPTPGLQYLPLYAMEFVGTTSPRFAVNAMVKCAEKLVTRARSVAQAVIVNTDGWVSDDGANYKLSLINAIKPDVVIALQNENELSPIIRLLPAGIKLIECSPPLYLKQRTTIERREFRYGTWYKYFKNSKVRRFYLDQVELLGWPPLQNNNPTLAKEIRNITGITPSFAASVVNTLWVIYLRFPGNVIVEKLRKFAKRQATKLNLIFIDMLENNVVGLYDKDNNTLGLGKIVHFDYKNMEINIRTPVTAEVSKIKIGKEKVPI